MVNRGIINIDYDGFGAKLENRICRVRFAPFRDQFFSQTDGWR
jgi:hypothetical protein